MTFEAAGREVIFNYTQRVEVDDAGAREFVKSGAPPLAATGAVSSASIQLFVGEPDLRPGFTARDDGESRHGPRGDDDMRKLAVRARRPVSIVLVFRFSLD
jgi:hypothetical protein